MSEPTADAGLERLYHWSASAADERTLDDILQETVLAYGDALALDDGICIPSGTVELYVAIVTGEGRIGGRPWS